jgi:hypothetical protein
MWIVPWLFEWKSNGIKIFLFILPFLALRGPFWGEFVVLFAPFVMSWSEFSPKNFWKKSFSGENSERSREAEKNLFSVSKSLKSQDQKGLGTKKKNKKSFFIVFSGFWAIYNPKARDKRRENSEEKTQNTWAKLSE